VTPIQPIGCPACGQKLRAGWRRCPVCHVPAAPGKAPAPLTPSAQRPSNRAVLAVSALMGALLAVGVPSVLSVSAPLTDARPALSRATTGQRHSPERTTLPAPELTAYTAQDQRRAGDSAYGRGDLDEAAGRYHQSVTAAPDDTQSRNNLAQVMVRQGRPVDALVELDAAIERDPNQWSYRFNRARVYGLLARWSDAVAEYRVAARLFPDDYATNYNLGLALLKLDQHAEAVTVLERAVALAPGQHDFLITLGTAYIGAGQTHQARTTFERFLTAAPSAPDAPRVRALLSSMDAGGQ
jgi:tetratricopeptide (TPR) repeat protein